MAHFNTFYSSRPLFLYTLWAIITLVAGVEVFPTDDALLQQAEKLVLAVNISLGGPFDVSPLTSQAGLGHPLRDLEAVSILGLLKFTNTSSADDVNTDDIVLVPCDSTSNDTQPVSTELIQRIVERNPRAVVLYSLKSSHCGVTDFGMYQSYFTWTSTESPTALFRAISETAEAPRAKILAQSVYLRQTGANATDPDQREQPTPAIAMSILYSVTGIITVLFLVIIATGSYRAHQNPARYGPRNGIGGRPGQSRAKGLARAMLETLPIVKFGDPEPPKRNSQDVELQPQADGPPKHGTAADGDEGKSEATANVSSMPPDGQRSHEEPQNNVSTSGDIADQNSLVCSICAEDFTRGEDVRVLPCNHKYHPACIDPWLLNVSSTCPLCRVDLRPAPSLETRADEPGPIQPSSATTGDVADAHHSRLQRYLALGHAPIHERMVALRQLARESRSSRSHSMTGANDSRPEEPADSRRFPARLLNPFSSRQFFQNRE